MESNIKLKMASYPSHVDEFFLKGWAGPIPIFTNNEIEHYREQLLQCDQKLNLMNSDFRCKSNVLFPWVDELSRNHKLLELVASILGENFSCWDALFWIKKPSDNKHVSFHQDGTYWNFDNKDKALTVWIPFQDVTHENGPVEYLASQKKFNPIHHEDVIDTNNLLMRGQTVKESIRETIAVPCKKGSVIIHNAFVVHGSQPNKSSEARYALGLIYVSTVCKPLLTIAPESTILVSGEDHYKHMLHSKKPTEKMDENIKHWQQAYDQQHLNYYSKKQAADDV